MIRNALLLVASAFIGGACTQRADRTDIRIVGTKETGVHFEIGNVRSKLATDAVDEAVRVNPRRIDVHYCIMSTPAERLVQLKTELEARLAVPMSFNMEGEGCPPIPSSVPRK